MTIELLFPDAVDEVTRWLEGLGAGLSKRCADKESGHRCRVWRLVGTFPTLNDTTALLVLKHDFPLTPARVELDPKFCLRLPHLEEDGNFCHGLEFDLADMAEAKAAVGRVLDRLDQYLKNCADLGWVEAEFQRERQDYWIRFAARAKAPASYRTRELLLDVDPNAEGPQEVAALSLATDGLALATSATSEPERVAKARGWAVGSVVRGGALVLRLPASERWTPSTWPQTFRELNELFSQLSSTANKLKVWYEARRWPNKAPVFVVLLQGPATFGWRLIPAPVARFSEPMLAAVQVSRIDRQWSLSRDHQAQRLTQLSGKKVVVFGCGALGAPVVELLARAGVGTIEVVDSQTFESENISRHLLGAPNVGAGKAAAMCDRVARNVPGANLVPFGETAMQWFTKAAQRQIPDLVLDCTGERSVRIGTAILRKSVLKSAPVMMAWMEPFCAAVHAVLTAGDDEWPASDPAETLVNFALWPDDTLVALPGCGQGFHPYGVADAWKAAGMVAEKALALLEGSETTSGVSSMVRSAAFFNSMAAKVEFNRPPPVPLGLESVIEHRTLPEMFSYA